MVPWGKVKAIETPVTSVAGVFSFLQDAKNRPEVSQGAVSAWVKSLPCGELGAEHNFSGAGFSIRQGAITQVRVPRGRRGPSSVDEAGGKVEQQGLFAVQADEPDDMFVG